MASRGNMARGDKKIHIIGVGSGSDALLTPEARAAIGACRSFATGRKFIRLVPEDARRHVIDHDLDAVRSFIAARLEQEDVCVLTSGDPGCFSILPFLKESFAGRIRVVPGISSVQALSARIVEPWDGWDLVSLHGRDAASTPRRVDHATAFFCDSSSTPHEVARALLENMGSCRAAIGSHLQTEEEAVWQGDLADAVDGEFPGNSLLVVFPQPAGSKDMAGARVSAPGIPDDQWSRREGIPLSKSEVRAVLLSKAQPSGRNVIWDIGSGTGSYAVECSLLEPEAHVIAVEKKQEGCELINENAARFSASVDTVCGDAPGCLDGLPSPDLAIIGGNDGRLAEIFEKVLASLRPGGRLAVTALLAETRKAAHGLFAHSGLHSRQATRVSIARGRATEWDEHNPVIIFTGDKE